MQESKAKFSAHEIECAKVLMELFPITPASRILRFPAVKQDGETVGSLELRAGGMWYTLRHEAFPSLKPGETILLRGIIKEG